MTKTINHTPQSLPTKAEVSRGGFYTKRFMAALTVLAMNLFAFAQTQEVTTFNYAGPFAVRKPLMMDSLDVNAKKFLDSNLLNTPLDLKIVETSAQITDTILPVSTDDLSLHLLGFSLSNTIFTSADIEVKGLDNYNIYIDGRHTTGGHADLTPATHRIVIKYMSKAEKKDTIHVEVEGKNLTVGTLGNTSRRTYDIYDVLHEKLYTGVHTSPDGKWMTTSTYQQHPNGSTTRMHWLWNLPNGTKARVNAYKWMPRSNKLYYTRKNEGVAGYTLILVDPATLQETIMTETLPSDNFHIAPTEDYVIYSETTDGPKENNDVHEIISPDDRQPGWRNRTNIFMYDLKTGLAQQLTYGHHNIWLSDISRDGKRLLLMKSENIIERMRPTDFNSLYSLNLETMQLDTLVDCDGFVDAAIFSPITNEVLVLGTPEAFGGIGLNINEGQTASFYDKQLFLLNISNPTDVTPLTKDFNPSVTNFDWSAADGNIYLSAEDKDCVHLFRLNPKTGRFTLIDTPEEVVGGWDISRTGNIISWYGESATVSGRLYALNTRNLKQQLIEDLHAEQFANVDLGECKPFNWINAEGDTICARYYLPPHFDPNRKYPVIVNYYGGCSPTSRSFGNRYSAQSYTALGYIMLVINPRGASGFGQKWSAAHVNTAGKGIAEDIIGTVKAFTAQHPFVNEKKIGCIGASYGGFMTQYLQTQTDIFAAAVSHAGISDHTSYWGEGYWGYSYSQVSMANSYPWTRRDLFVDQSPLFNADKIHTPLLFVHGSADTNVPVGESIQMYTALKLLGRPTALVLVEGENHWIMEYRKRIRWQHTIWAWFAKYLQDDDSWWEHIYKHKDL